MNNKQIFYKCSNLQGTTAVGIIYFMDFVHRLVLIIKINRTLFVGGMDLIPVSGPRNKVRT
jgi:hypothetical protein